MSRKAKAKYKKRQKKKYGMMIPPGMPWQFVAVWQAAVEILEKSRKDGEYKVYMPPEWLSKDFLVDHVKMVTYKLQFGIDPARLIHITRYMREEAQIQLQLKQ
jgi:hypothetical protein